MTLGEKIREARTGAGLTQEKLAERIEGMSAADLSRAERDLYVPAQSVLREIARATGVTQASLLNLARDTGKSEGKSREKARTSASSGKTGGKTTGRTDGKTGGKTTGRTDGKTGGKTTAGTKKTAKETGLTLTAAEKNLVEVWRRSSAEQRKNALKILKGEDVGSMVDSLGESVGKVLGSVLGSSVESLLGGKK